MVGLRKNKLIVAVAGLVLAAGAGLAKADTILTTNYASSEPLLPGKDISYGGTVTIPGLGKITLPSLDTIDLTGDTVLVSTGLENFNTSLSPEEHGTGIEDVLKTSTGTLDFVYQFSVNTVDKTGGSVNSLQAGDFTGFSTGVYYSGNLPTFLAGFTIPKPTASSGKNSTNTVGYQGDVSRGGSGSSVTFGSLVLPVGANDESPIFVIKTNATTYKPGGFSVQDDGVATLAGYQPAISVGNQTPLPQASLGFFGLVGLLGIGRAMKSRAC